MAQDFTPVYDIDEDVNDTMVDVIDGNSVTLQTNFSGPAEVPAGIRVPSQWWSDTTTGTGHEMLRIRNQADSAWLDVYNFGLEEIVLSNDQVTTAKISAAARKGTIVEGESIEPASCTLQAKFKNVSMPGCPNEFFELFGAGGQTSFGVISGPLSGGWETLYTTRIFVPDDAGTLYITALQTTCKIQFIIGSYTSTNYEVAAGPSWGNEVFYNTSSLSGWYDLEIQGISTIVTGGLPHGAYGGFSGLASRWEV